MTSEPRQVRLLTRTFFARLFESELIPPGLAQVQVVISVFAFLAAPSLMLPLFLMKKYAWISNPDAVRMLLAQDRTMALLLSMTATAFISLVIWENVFPDRRDSRILGVLPIRQRSFVVARLAAVVGLFALLFLVTAAVSSIAFGVLTSMTALPQSFLRVVVAHFLAVSAAEASVFFTIVAVQCALMSVAGPAAAHRLAVVLQVGMIVLVLQMPMVLPGRDAFAPMPSGAPLWTALPSAVLLPPLWFLSLYQWLAGAAYEGASHLVRLAVLLGLGMPLLALGFYAVSYRRLTRLAVEGRPEAQRARVPLPRRITSSVAGFMNATPDGAAVCAFTLRTLARSRQHRMILAVWVGVAVALTVSSALPLLVRFGWSALDRPQPSLLVGPLIFAALIQTGMRSLFAIPVELRANWVLKMCEPRWLQAPLGGAAAALIICGVLPPVLLAFISATWLWSAPVGLMHALFTGMLALVFVQVLMLGVDRIPFTCTYSPGAARIGTLWPAYLTVFATSTYGMAAAEAAWMRRPSTFAIVLLFFAGVAALLWRLRLHRVSQLPGLCFEAEADDAMTVITLNS